MGNKAEPTVEQAKQKINEAISEMQAYLSDMAENNSNKAVKLSYWIIDWIRFLKREEHFKPNKLRRYKRGEIIKVHLGFNIGSEYGGLHYAVVIDDNHLFDPVIRIIPLTSLKAKHDISSLPPGSIYIGNELFRNLNANYALKINSMRSEINSLAAMIEDPAQADNPSVSDRFGKLFKEKELLDRMRIEVGKMKQGSVALVGQITTISKLRIYDPKSNKDVLSGIKLSNEKLDLIDSEIRKLYTKKIDKNSNEA